jgi:hypothetical protein
MNEKQNKPTKKITTSSKDFEVVPIFKEEIDAEKLAKALILLHEKEMREFKAKQETEEENQNGLSSNISNQVTGRD